VATAFTRLAGFARVFRARVAAVFTLEVRFLAELFLDALFLPVLFLAVVFLPVLFLVDAPPPPPPPPFRAVAVLRLRELPLLFVAVLLFRVLVERFLVEAPLFAVERELPVLLRRALLFAPARPVDFRPADFALELPRDDFLVVAIHPLLVSR
jgi:hypothetical protein